MKPGYPEVRSFVPQRDVATSLISRAEALGYHDLEDGEASKLKRLFDVLAVQPITACVIDGSIDLPRRRKSMKTVDAIIAATALEMGSSRARQHKRL